MEKLQHKINKYHNKYILLSQKSVNSEDKINYNKQIYNTSQKSHSCKYFLYF